MDQSVSPLKFAKPLKRKTVKAKQDRAESVVKVSVREQCVERDGYCRFSKDIPSELADCRGLSQWAHLEDKRRARTRGMEPTARHTTEKSAMLCARHHRDYDAGLFWILFMSPIGANGPISYVRHAP